MAEEEVDLERPVPPRPSDPRGDEPDVARELELELVGEEPGPGIYGLLHLPRGGEGGARDHSDEEQGRKHGAVRSHQNNTRSTATGPAPEAVTTRYERPSSASATLDGTPPNSSTRNRCWWA